MRVLLIGSGGREHALAWKIAASLKVSRLFCAPGNGGIDAIAECVSLGATDVKAIVSFAKERKIDLVIVGPEAPLVEGLVDALEAAGIQAFGPRKEGALLEGSKSFAKSLMEKYGIPTGKAGIFTVYGKALDYLAGAEPPYVIKADGLAAGKGVVVTADLEEAEKAIRSALVDGAFAEAGERVLIEEYLDGPELSLLAFTDGKTVIPMVPAQDYKRVYDGDMGPNTGGMGSYSPVPILTEPVYEQIVSEVLVPIVAALATEGIDYRGVLYAGLVLTKSGPKVMEFNARFGDPETQAILPRLKSDLIDVMLAVAEGRLAGQKLDWSSQPCVTVVLASGGYPGKHKTGFEISGLEEAEETGTAIFHAGTSRANGKILTSGGRVLNVSALGTTFEEARNKAYEALARIKFDGMHYRKDIAIRAVEQEASGKLRLETRN
ncbi:MAG: phosphoribosylamine--glycine ligase [Actinobacteria bacterium]|nr:phosphoribosylamine--glycine ligase [Actinomycetota bacterium]